MEYRREQEADLVFRFGYRFLGGGSKVRCVVRAC
jgi:hypothetical protein